jgi:hypothetical protein
MPADREEGANAVTRGERVRFGVFLVVGGGLTAIVLTFLPLFLAWVEYYTFGSSHVEDAVRMTPLYEPLTEIYEPVIEAITWLLNL